DRTTNWIALVRHSRGTAAAITSRFSRFRNFVLHHEADVAGHLPEHSCQYSTGTHQSGEALALCMPGRIGTTKFQLTGQGACNINSLSSKRCQGSTRTAKLND